MHRAGFKSGRVKAILGERIRAGAVFSLFLRPVPVKQHIPNAITCGNLLSGCIGIVAAFQGNLVLSAYMVGIALVFDFFDGFAARLLHVSGEMGKQLDSLADLVTFGVLPGVIIYQLLNRWVMQDAVSHFDLLGAIQGKDQAQTAKGLFLLPYVGFLIPVFSALRLAKFNIDTRQAQSFIGVPTPANAMLICSIPLILDLRSPLSNLAENGSPLTALAATFATTPGESPWAPYLLNPWFLCALTVIMSFLMVAELPLFALKFKNFGWTDNKLRFSFIALALVILLLLRFVGIPIVILLYVLLSIVNNILNKYQHEVQG